MPANLPIGSETLSYIFVKIGCKMTVSPMNNKVFWSPLCCQFGHNHHLGRRPDSEGSPARCKMNIPRTNRCYIFMCKYSVLCVWLLIMKKAISRSGHLGVLGDRARQSRGTAIMLCIQNYMPMHRNRISYCIRENAPRDAKIVQGQALWGPCRYASSLPVSYELSSLRSQYIDHRSGQCWCVLIT